MILEEVKTWGHDQLVYLFPGENLESSWGCEDSLCNGAGGPRREGRWRMNKRWIIRKLQQRNCSKPRVF